MPLWEFGLPDDASIDVEDMVTGRRFTWHGKIQHIHLDPFYKPYAVGDGSRREHAETLEAANAAS